MIGIRIGIGIGIGIGKGIGIGIGIEVPRLNNHRIRARARAGDLRRRTVLGSAPKARRIRTCSTASRLHAARRGVIPVMASALLTIFFLSFRDKPSR